MDDRMVVNTGMAYSEKTMEAADEVIQALIIALSGKSTAEQNHVLLNLRGNHYRDNEST